MDNDKIATLLGEIRDSHQQTLDEYRRVANEALALQKQALAVQQESIERQKLAVDTQLRHVRLYKIIVFVTLPVIVVVLLLVFHLLKFV